MAEGDRAIFAQELLRSLRAGTFTRNPSASEEINDFAERVKTRLDEMTNLLDVRGILQYEAAADFVETLEAKLRNAMDERRYARVGGVLGNITRIIGNFFFTNPYGQAVFWGGLFVSILSDFVADNESEQVKRFVAQINTIFKDDEDSFRDLSRAIQRLDNTIKARTGWSLYSEEFRNFLSVSAQSPESISNLPECASLGEDQRTNLITLARNSNAVRTLAHIMNNLYRADTSYVSIVYHLLESISAVRRGTSRSLALQFGEVALRGAQLFREYKQDQATLAEVCQGVGRMRRELQAIRIACPD